MIRRNFLAKLCGGLVGLFTCGVVAETTKTSNIRLWTVDTHREAMQLAEILQQYDYNGDLDIVWSNQNIRVQNIQGDSTISEIIEGPNQKRITIKKSKGA